MKRKLFVLLFIVFGCNRYVDEGTDTAYPNLMTITQSMEDIQFTLDESTGLVTQCLQYYETIDSSYLVFLNSYTNSIYFYNIQTKKRRKIFFPIEGSDGVGKLSGFYLVNFDSIFLTSSDRYQINLVVSPFLSSRKFRQIKLIPREIGSSSAKALGYTGNRTFYIENELYVLGVPDADPTSPSFFDVGKNLQIINLDDSVISSTSLYTEDYKKVWSPFYFDYYHDYLPERKSFVYSPPVSDSILIKEIKSEGYKRYYAGSDFIDVIEPMSGTDYVAEKRQMHYIQNASYSTILYDKYRELFYRFVELPNREAIDNGDPWMTSKIPSIVILNKDYEKVGEKKLSANEFLPNMSFVTKDGLFISQPVLLEDGSGVSDDILRFVLFRIEEL